MQHGRDNFKTSHVIVYRFLRKIVAVYIEFQNISCYCLSHQKACLERGELNFKTSHVIVYHGTVVIDTEIDTFQNISCYCLSMGLGRMLAMSLNFKTSHVIVYRCIYRSESGCNRISKHLMLLFIPRISAFFSFSPPLFPLIFSIFLHFLPANTLILDRPTYHPINLLIFQAFLDFSFFFRLVKIL